MVVDAAAGAAREILVVLALAVLGLLLALVAAFAPWYELAAEPSRAGVVEMHAPTNPPDRVGAAANDGG